MADNEVTRIYFVFIVFVEDIKLYFDKELLPTIKDILNTRKIQKNDLWVVMLFEYLLFLKQSTKQSQAETCTEMRRSVGYWEFGRKCCVFLI
jgi:hypothetical protein